MTSPNTVRVKMRHARQRGAALIVGLLLLVIITLLAVTGMTTANTELIMAGNEQVRLNSFRAAEAGVDDAITLIETVGTTPLKCVKGATKPLYTTATDRFATASMYVGSGGLIPGWGVYSGEALFFAIRSSGASARGARTDLSQGVVKILPSSGTPPPVTALPLAVPQCEPNDPE
jgi:type IV pilus assembly protein PilX